MTTPDKHIEATKLLAQWFEEQDIKGMSELHGQSVKDLIVEYFDKETVEEFAENISSHIK